jgi:methyl-accepting chemotaxis protein
MGSEKRKLKNVTLTGKYHWSYVGGWLLLNLILTLVVEGFALASLYTIRDIYTSMPLSSYAMGSVAIAMLLLISISGVALLWAHRTAGVHIKTESVFRRVADGDRSARLRYRAGDKLEDVEEAFDRMMTSVVERKTPLTAESKEDAEESPEARQRRSWKSMQLTSKYQYNYMFVWMLISLSLLIACYGIAVFFFYLRHYIVPEAGLNLTAITIVATVLAPLAGGVILWRGFLTAHRLAGVHIKLIRTLDRVAQGEVVELRFRSSDKLDNLQSAFQSMIESLQKEPEG